MSDKLGILGYDYVEFYVGSAKIWAYWHAKALGMKVVGYLGPETGMKDKSSYYLEKNNFRVVITTALNPVNYEITSFVTKHGDGVKRWALKVKDVKSAFEISVQNGAIPERSPQLFQDGNGSIEEAAIKLYDDAEIVFINRDKYNAIKA